MRKSNKRASYSNSQPVAIAKPAMMHAGNQDIAEQSIQMLREFFQRQQSSNLLNIDFSTPLKRSKTDGRLLAIENGSPDASLTPPTIGKGSGGIAGGGIEGEPTDSEAEEEPNIDNLLQRTSAVIEKAKKSRKESNVKKRPAAASKKKPAGAKSVIECTTCPSMPSVTESIGSLMWKGCKIQSNPNNRKWRVFPKPDTHLYDKGFPWGADPNAAWKSVLAYCNNPVLPKGTKPFK